MRTFPRVPRADGVPSLPRAALSSAESFNTITLGVLQGALWDAISRSPAWGIYPNTSDSQNSSFSFFHTPSSIAGIKIGPTGRNNPVLLADTCYSVDVGQDNRVSDYPVEGGTFASYNKVVNPVSTLVRLVKGGSEAEMGQFLDTLAKYASGTLLVSVVTSSKIYLDQTIEFYRYRRAPRDGAYILKIDIGLRQIRQVTVNYSRTQNASSATAFPAPPTARVEGVIY